MMVKYKRTGGDITKDGHTMFHCDIVKELNRKAYLEKELEAKNQEISDRQHAEDKNTDLILKLTDDLEAKDKTIAEMRELVECVAHVGCNYGYGPIRLEESHIKKARELIELTKGQT